MKGLSYIVDENKNLKGFQVIFSKWGRRQQEDIEDIVISLLKRNQKTIPWEVIKAEINDKKKKEKTYV